MNLSAVDLNLLVVLDALLTDGSVTRAAKRLNLSQPAVSNALGRLRDLLGDPLLVRTARGMLPTERAQAVRPALARLLREAHAVLEPPAEYDPASAVRTFSIAASDYAAVVILPAIVRRMRRVAPGVSLRVEHMDLASKAAHFHALASGSIDLIVGLLPRASRMPAGLLSDRLAEERLVVIGRRDHPALPRRPSLSALRAAAFVQVGSPHRELVDGWLMARGLTPRVAVTVPTLDAALRAAATSDLVVIGGARLATAFGHRLMAAPLPFHLEPLSLAAVWTEETPTSAARAWFRQLVLEGRQPQRRS